MKSNITFITESMERAGQYSSKSRAKANIMISRRHKIIESFCYRMNGDDVVKYRCYVPVLITGIAE